MDADTMDFIFMVGFEEGQLMNDLKPEWTVVDG
jgi:hypothetical protein